MAALAKASKRSNVGPSELDKRRKATKFNLHRWRGFAPIPMSAAIEARRLTSPSGSRVLSAIMEEATGRKVELGESFTEETEPITIARLAELAVLEERTTQREFRAMVTAHILEVQEIKRGLYVIRPLMRTWHELPDYAAGPVEEPQAPQEAAVTEEAPKPKEKTTTNVTRKPVHVPAGKKSKEYPVECGVSAVQFDVRKVDADCSAVVMNGVMCVTLEPKVEAPRAEAPQTRKPEREYVCDHPRAQELCAIFDPLLWKSSHKTLSGDISCLQRACEAIGDTPHEVLVKAVQSRSSRPISGGPAVVAICREIAANKHRSDFFPVEIPKKSASTSIDPASIRPWDPEWYKKVAK